MKPPLTVEARVAEELRNWLASELEQLDASNTNQFAHHVVTILLHEDLDIEDEPLTASDDFLQNIYSIKKGKTRDRQKKAAVQFLRSAVCCSESDETEIQGVVEELMVKIDETKSKMNKKGSKRNLLAPIAVNINSATAQVSLKCDGREDERRYNEAFPSLASKESPDKEGAASSGVNSVWSKLPSLGKENGLKKVKKRTSQFLNRHYVFTSQEEAQACSIARQVAAMALAETSMPNAESADIFPPYCQDSSLSSFEDSSVCWKSAFETVVLTKVFSPTLAPLQVRVFPPYSTSTDLKVFSPNVVRGSQISHPNLNLGKLNFVDKAQFHPISDDSSQYMFPKEPFDSVYDDLEIRRIFESFAQQEDKLGSKKKKYKRSETPDLIDSIDDLENALQFPCHCGDFWSTLISDGGVALYPKLTESQPLVNEMNTLKGSVLKSDDHTTLVTSTVDRSPHDLSSLCLKVLKKELSMQEIKRQVLSYHTNNVKYSGLVLNGMVETLLKRKEKALLLSRCNVNESEIKESLDEDKIMEACIYTLTRLVSSFIPCSEMNDLNSLVDVRTGSDIQDTNIVSVGHRQVDFNLSNFEAGASCISTTVHETLMINQVASYCTYERVSGSLDFNDITRDGSVVLKEEAGTPSGSGFSPSFLNTIDLTYLDDCDNRQEIVEDSQISMEKALIWEANTENNGLIDYWPKRDKNSKSKTLHQDWNMSQGCYLPPLQPIQTSGLDIDDQQDIGYFSNDMKQVQWDNPFSLTEWDYICKDWLSKCKINGSFGQRQYESPPNLYKPSLLTSCLSKEGAQFLQNAFVNSIFSSNFTDQMWHLKDNAKAVNCSALEQFWLSKDRKKTLEHIRVSRDFQPSFALSVNSTPFELIRGCTCSSWLENNCKLGCSCPFAHPSI